MKVRDLFDYAVLRAVLTVSESELPDSVLCKYNVEDDVEAELDRRLADWETISDEKQLRQLRLFSKYWAGSVVAKSAPVFILTKETDGNNEGQRSNKEGFLFLADSLRSQAEKAMDMLLDLRGEKEEADAPVLLDRVPPDRDVITEARSTV